LTVQAVSKHSKWEKIKLMMDLEKSESPRNL
jgi:hypothetical protein